MKKLKKNNKLITVVIVYIIFALLIPMILHFFYKTGWSDWYNELFTYLGGAIGGIATLIAIYLTLRQNNKDNNNMIKLQLDLKRVDVMPYINIEALSTDDFIKSIFSQETDKKYDEDYTNKRPSGYFVFKENYVEFCTKLNDECKHKLSEVFDKKEFFNDGKIKKWALLKNDSYEQPLKLTNIGSGPAINVKIDLYNYKDELIQEFIQVPFNFTINSEAYFRLVFLSYPQGKYSLIFFMTDIYGKNFYMQKYYFEYKKNKFVCGNIKSPIPIEKYNI